MHRNQRKTASEKWMPRISDLNFSGLCRIRVLEQGIELMDRSTKFHMSGF